MSSASDKQLHSIRDYERIAADIAPRESREETMREVADRLWEDLSRSGVSWVGFYIDDSSQPIDRRLTLGPCRDKPACSPIGLHGVCGQSLVSRSVRIVRDVLALGANYVACDPRDRSEIVIPLIDERGKCWGVLDLDSWDVGAFDQHDADGLQRVLRAAGLTAQ